MADEIEVNTFAAQVAAQSSGLPPGTPCLYPLTIVAGETAVVECDVINEDASEGSWRFVIASDSSVTSSATYFETKKAPPTTQPATTQAPIRPLPSAFDPRFGTCKEAKSNGYGPYYSGDTEYDWYQDRDSDGIVCE